MQVVRNFIACEWMKVCMRACDNILRLTRAGHGKPPGARNDEFRRKLVPAKMTRRINLHRIARSHCQPHYLPRCSPGFRAKRDRLSSQQFQGLSEKNCLRLQGLFLQELQDRPTRLH